MTSNQSKPVNPSRAMVITISRNGEPPMKARFGIRQAADILTPLQTLLDNFELHKGQHEDIADCVITILAVHDE